MTDRDLAYTPAHQLVDMIARKRVSPVELTELYLRRIEDLDPGLNAFLTVTGDKAMATARLAEEAVTGGETLAPLHGYGYYGPGPRNIFVDPLGSRTHY